MPPSGEPIRKPAPVSPAVRAKRTISWARKKPAYAFISIVAIVLVFKLGLTAVNALFPESIEGAWIGTYPAGKGLATVTLVLRESKDRVEGTITWEIADSVSLAYRVAGFQTGNNLSLNLYNGDESKGGPTFQGYRTKRRGRVLFGSISALTREPLPIWFAKK